MQLNYSNKKRGFENHSILNFIKNYKDAGRIVRDLLGFFIARVVLFNSLSPFALGYYGASILYKGTSPLLFIAILLGLLTQSSKVGYKYVIVFLFVGTCKYLFFNQVKKYSKIWVVAAMCGTLFVFNVFEAYLNGWAIDSMLMGGIEVVLCGTMLYLFSYSMPILSGASQRSKFSNQEILSLTIYIGFMIAGLYNFKIANFSSTYIVAIFLILVMARQGGVLYGTLTGTIVGLMLAISNTEVTPFVIATFSIAGMLAGFFQEMGKSGVLVGLFVGLGLVGFYINEGFTGILYGKEAVVSSLLFFLIPQKVLQQGAKLIQPTEEVMSTLFNQRLKEISTVKIEKFSEAFAQLAATFERLSETKSNLSDEEITQLFNEVAAQNCTNCKYRSACWKRDIYQTYHAFFGMLTTAESKGLITVKDVMPEFHKQCIKVEDVVRSMNQLYEIYFLNLKWNNKVAQSRHMVSQQLHGVSKVIKNLVHELDLELNIKEELQDSLELELEKYRIPIKNIAVYQNTRGLFEVLVYPKTPQPRYYWDKHLIPIVSKVLGKSMMLKEAYHFSEQMDRIELIEREKYRVSTAVAKVSKEEGVSGDNYTVIELKNGHSVLALSDGMGSGEHAHLESKVTIELLEQFLDLGFDKVVTVNLINSILVMKSSEENFSTLDMVMIDQYSGKAEFLKIGAASSFIKRQRNVEIIRSTSLPVGILSTVDMEVSTTSFEEGDILVMMSDGVLDSCVNHLQKEDWMSSVLFQVESQNIKEIAEFIISKAKEYSKDGIEDDMTVLVAKLWKSVG